jgi:hypothetical protein
MERSVTDFDQANPVRVFFFSFFSSAPFLVIDQFQCCCVLDSKWVERISEMLIAIKILFLFLLVSGIQLGFWVSFRALCFPFVSIHAEMSSNYVFWNSLHLGRFCLSCKQKTMSKFCCHRIGFQHY